PRAPPAAPTGSTSRSTGWSAGAASSPSGAVRDAPYAVRRGAVAAKLCAIEAVLADPATVVLKESPRVTVARVGSGEHQLVLKRFREATPLRVLEGLFVGSGALRVWRAAALMRSAGFRVPE